MDQFIELNINPAKVVALYDENVSGRLHVERSEWVQLFGGPTHEQVSNYATDMKKNDNIISDIAADKQVTIGSSFKMGLNLGALLPGTSHSQPQTEDEKDTSSLHSVEQPVKKVKPKPGELI